MRQSGSRSPRPLLVTDCAVVGSITNAKAIHDQPIPQSKPQHFLYYMEGAQASNDGTYHILGQPEAQTELHDGRRQCQARAAHDTRRYQYADHASRDTASGSAGFTTRNSRRNRPLRRRRLQPHHQERHQCNFTSPRRSGTSIRIGSTGRCLIRDPPTRPFEYHNFNATLSGPIVIPKIYNGRTGPSSFWATDWTTITRRTIATVSVPIRTSSTGISLSAGSDCRFTIPRVDHLRRRQ